jgi:hypothetical protein
VRTKTLVSTAVALMATALALTPAAAQPRPGQPPAQAPQPGPGDEIRLDEQASLRASAIEAKMAALRANYQLILRQIQDMENEHKSLYEERKKLLEEVARRQRVEVKDPNEWAFDTKSQRYLRLKKAP